MEVERKIAKIKDKINGNRRKLDASSYYTTCENGMKKSLKVASSATIIFVVIVAGINLTIALFNCTKLSKLRGH
eukprot:6929333-Ditylum_brightwellii.AAC.1